MEKFIFVDVNKSNQNQKIVETNNSLEVYYKIFFTRIACHSAAYSSLSLRSFSGSGVGIGAGDGDLIGMYSGGCVQSTL
jgi:hypothetical protein